MEQRYRKNVDLLDVLAEIVRENTRAFRGDFDYDCTKLLGAAEKEDRFDRTFYWMSRPHGTWCVLERDVFIQDSDANYIWTFYENEADQIRAYRVYVAGIENGVLRGDIWTLDYGAQLERIKKSAVPIQGIDVILPLCKKLHIPFEEWKSGRRSKADWEYDFLKIHFVSKDEALLNQAITMEHQIQRRHCTPRKAKAVPAR